MAITITRTPLVDDDGTGTTGTVLNNAWYQQLCNAIDAALAQVNLAIRQIVSAFGTGNFSTTSATPIDVTNMVINVTTAGANAQILLMAVFPCKVTTGSAYFNWRVDGGADGNIEAVSSSVADETITMFRLAAIPTAGAHVLQLRVKSGSGGTVNCNMAGIMVGTMIALELR